MPTELSNAQNDAMWAVKMGKKPSDAQAKEIQVAAAKVGGDEAMACNALVRMLGGYGADSPLVEMLKAICEKNDVSADLISMLDMYADEENKPDSFDISQMSNILNMLIDVDELDDPSSRPAEESSGDDEEEEPLNCAGIQNLLDSTPWQVLTGIWTAWALFSTDIAMAFMGKSADYGIAVVTFIAFLFFVSEFLGNMISGRDYGTDMGNLFFWLDAIGTFSLIPDFLILFMDEELEVNDNVTLARVARAARIGARLSRLTKVFRVKDGQSSFTAMMADSGIDLDEDDGAEDVSSQVGAKVADGISKKVVILVIVLLVAIPIFTYHEPAGGIRQTKEEAVAMLKSIKDSTSPGLGTCMPAVSGTSANGGALAGLKFPKRTPGDVTNDGVPYVGYPALSATRAEKVLMDWSPCCGMKPDLNNAGMVTAGEFGPDGLVANTDCIATCTDASGNFQKADATDCSNDGDVAFAGMAEAERLSLVEFLQLQGDRVIMFSWNRGIAKGEERMKVLYPDTYTDSKTTDELCTAYHCASDDFLPIPPKIGEEAAPADSEAYHGPGTFFKMSDVIYSLRKAEMRKYGDSAEECTVLNGCMTEEERAKKPETTYNMGGLEFWVDLSAQTKDEATTQIAYMWFIIVIFAIASLVFMASLEKDVIQPVEGMTKAMTMITKSLIDLGGSGGNTDGEAAYIESSILKIVGLLNVSFGEAGTKIIQRNMNSGSSELNSAIPGEKVSAVYGMSDIREFTATTEALNQDIVLFVNEFANICHGSCIETGGAPNKNVGDAFLCVWKDQKDGSVQCDAALAAYRQAVQKIRSSGKLDKLIGRREIEKRFPGAEREFGTYLPSMGFGLHHGTSIEGAIGTSLKMDAAYLGADVDLADVLEINTKEYKAPILMTEQFYNQLSEKVQATCRKVDRVIGGAASEPFLLYAANIASADGSFFNRDIEEDVFALDAEGNDSGEYGGSDGRWDAMVDPWNDDFEAAVDAYIAGDWSKASSGLASCLSDRPWDGPGLKLQEFIQSNGGQAPRGWKGFQELA